jgi:membrane-bound lytic murein transglycosylase B
MKLIIKSLLTTGFFIAFLFTVINSQVDRHETDFHTGETLLLVSSAENVTGHAADSTFFVNDDENLASLIEYFDQNGFDIRELMNDSRFEIYEGIGDRFRHSAERKTLTLDEYKGILGFDDKKRRITGFINDNLDPMIKAEETYGIPRYVIAAIIGIESDYGKNIGRFNPFNTYVSMYSEDYRAEFARAQLLELLKFTERNNIDVFELKSSYAGAMSFAQFIPYSLNKWFVGDDIFDMENNIQSVANYLAYFVERTGSIERAVFRYNPSQMYADAVMALAKEAEELYTEAS